MCVHTGEYLPEKLIFGSTNPQYDKIVHWTCNSMNNMSQESRREGWTDAAIMLCKLNKSQ